MPAFWNITMDKKMEQRFEAYRKEYEKNAGKRVTRAEFGRIIFEFWENVQQKYKEDLKHHEKQMQHHMDEAAKHEREFMFLKKMAG